MLKIYPFLIALSGLLLAGCGRERARQETATPAASAAADTASQVASVAPATRAAADTAAPLLATAAAPQPSPRIKRGATVLADVPAEDATAEPAFLAADSARTGELRRYLLSELPAAQFFSIQSGRDTMVTGPQGTQLLIAADSWQLPVGDTAAVVQLELREFYRVADMLLAGLSTTAGPDLLETAGMLHLRATAGGRPVQLRPGRYVHLRMPAARRQEGMRLFEGEVQGADHRVNWQLPTSEHAAAGVEPLAGKKAKRKRSVSTSQRASRIDSVRTPRPKPQWPEYKELESALLKEYKSASQVRQWRRNRKASRVEKDRLALLSDEYDQRIVRLGWVDFNIDSTGVLRQPVLHPGSDPELGAQLSAALLKLKRWEAARMVIVRNKRRVGFEPVAATGQMQLLVNKAGHAFVEQGEWTLARDSRARVRYFRHELDSLWTNPAFRRRYQHDLDSIAASKRVKAEKQAQAKAQAELARLRTQFTDTSRAAISELGVYNELSSQKLQWVNCDRFVAAGGKQVNYQVFRNKDAVVKLLFKDSRSIVSDDNRSTKPIAAFHSATLKQPVTVVAIRREDGVTYLAVQETHITKMPLQDLDFHPVTMAQLRAELARLN